MTAVRTTWLCSLGRMAGKNVSIMERICVKCHGKKRFLDTGSSVSTHTHTQYYYSYTVIYIYSLNTTICPSILFQLHDQNCYINSILLHTFNTGIAMANYPQKFAQDAVCQSHTGQMTGLWFLPARPLRLNTNE